MTPPVAVTAPVRVMLALIPEAVKATVPEPALISCAAAVFETVKLPVVAVTETAPPLLEIPVIESTVPMVRVAESVKLKLLPEPVMLAASVVALLARLSVTEPTLVTLKFVSVRVPTPLWVIVLPERRESAVVPLGFIAAVTVTAPLVVLPILMIPAVTVLISALVNPKVPEASAPPISINCPDVLGLRVAMALVAVVSPVRVI